MNPSIYLALIGMIILCGCKSNENKFKIASHRPQYYTHFNKENTDIIVIDGTDQLIINSKSVSYDNFTKYLTRENIELQVYESADPQLFFKVRNNINPNKKVGTNIKLTAITDK